MQVNNKYMYDYDELKKKVHVCMDMLYYNCFCMEDTNLLNIDQ